MADKKENTSVKAESVEAPSKFEQMLEKLVADGRAGADDLFHEIVVEKSRSIYEDLLEDDIKEIETGFKEIAALAHGCKYRDCILINEPNCAVNQGLINNEIASLRYKNYKKLVQEFQ